MKIKLTEVRRVKNRCDSVKMETNGVKRRTWRCQLEFGHEGEHVSLSGHRRWPQEPSTYRCAQCSMELRGNWSDIAMTIKFHDIQHEEGDGGSTA